MGGQSQQMHSVQMGAEYAEDGCSRLNAIHSAALQRNATRNMCHANPPLTRLQ